MHRLYNRPPRAPPHKPVAKERPVGVFFLGRDTPRPPQAGPATEVAGTAREGALVLRETILGEAPIGARPCVPRAFAGRPNIGIRGRTSSGVLRGCKCNFVYLLHVRVWMLRSTCPLYCRGKCTFVFRASGTTRLRYADANVISALMSYSMCAGGSSLGRVQSRDVLLLPARALKRPRSGRAFGWSCAG